MITPILNVSSLLLGLTAWVLGARAVARRRVSLLSLGAVCWLWFCNLRS